jgi:hypothetical protein
MLQRNGQRLKIKLPSGKYFPVSAKNPSDEFNVLELQAGGHLAVIRQQFHEGNSWQVLDLQEEKLTEVYGYPLFSPDGTRFVAASEDLMADFSDTVLDVYQVTADGITRSFRAIKPKDDWAARNVRWQSNNIVRFSQARLVASSSVRFDERPTYLLFRGHWALHRGEPH